MVRPTITILTGLILTLSAERAAWGQPLYVGDQEFDTANEADMAALLERCASLAANSPDADQVIQFTAEILESTLSTTDDQGIAPPALPSKNDVENEGPLPVTIDLDAITSSGDGAQPAGEGAGEGVEPPDGGTPSEQEEASIDVDAITLEACKEAGISY